MLDELDDIELLRRYAEKQSEAAFAEVVRRQIALVYHAALRQTGGNRSLAEDVTQSVFTDLARKARSLLDRPVLTGWLFTSTRFAAANARRAEQRRQVRENAAHVMQTLTAESTAASDWEQLRPVIDEVLGELDDRDRDAVLMRFFQERSFAEIGAKLSLTEDTARIRVARALEKLHVRLARRGVKSTTMALAAALGGQASATAPVGLATSVANVALASAGGAAVAGVFGFLSAGKIVGGAAIVAAAVAVGLIFFASDEPAPRPTTLPVTLASVAEVAAPTPAEIEKSAEAPAASPRPETAKSAETTTVAAKVAPARPSVKHPAPPITDPNYRLRVGDSVLIWVRGFPDTATSQRIGRRGEVRLPLIPEELKISGKTLREAQGFLEKLFRERKLVKAPVFTVVVQASLRSVRVLGAVESPGLVYFPTDVESLHLDEVIAEAGGFLRTANLDLVTVTSTDENGREASRRLRLKGKAPTERTDENAAEFLIFPGDRIWIPSGLPY